MDSVPGWTGKYAGQRQNSDKCFADNCFFKEFIVQCPYVCGGSTGENAMSKQFPVFLDISNKKISVYGAGRIASRRVGTLLAFEPLLTVFAPEASERIQKAAEEGKLIWNREVYRPGSIPPDTWMVLAATDHAAVNEEIYRECREKGILVNVCSNREHCDFQFPGIAAKGDLVIGINAGGSDHRMAKIWTDRIRKEVEKDGYDNQTETSSDNGKLKKDGQRDQNG